MFAHPSKRSVLRIQLVTGVATGAGDIVPFDNGVVIPHKLSVVAGEAEKNRRNSRQEVGSRFSRNAGSSCGTFDRSGFR